MIPARDNILNRIRQALRTPAAQPAKPTEAPIFEPVTDPEQRFQKEFKALHGEILASAADLKEFLAGFSAIATDGSDRVTGIVGPGTGPVGQADLGVTGCDCLVAQTGSIIVSTRSAGGRAMSVLPPVHLVIAGRDQLVPDLATAMSVVRDRYRDRWPSALSVITGPSRTADIEKNLVMGAHGPKRLVLWWES